MIPIDATGKAWVRFAAYDSAGDAAFAQPQKSAPHFPGGSQGELAAGQAQSAVVSITRGTGLVDLFA